MGKGVKKKQAQKRQKGLGINELRKQANKWKKGLAEEIKKRAEKWQKGLGQGVKKLHLEVEIK